MKPLKYLAWFVAAGAMTFTLVNCSDKDKSGANKFSINAQDVEEPELQGKMVFQEKEDYEKVQKEMRLYIPNLQGGYDYFRYVDPDTENSWLIGEHGLKHLPFKYRGSSDKDEIDVYDTKKHPAPRVSVYQKAYFDITFVHYYNEEVAKENDAHATAGADTLDESLFSQIMIYREGYARTAADPWGPHGRHITVTSKDIKALSKKTGASLYDTRNTVFNFYMENIDPNRNEDKIMQEWKEFVVPKLTPVLQKKAAEAKN